MERTCSTMLCLGVLGASLTALACTAFAENKKNAPGPLAERTPVLLELFTSEGCSSCPPAERLLGDLARRQPLADVTIVLLSFHVDYWDNLGWVDPFSSAAATARQQGYAHSLGHRDTYTPQAVVDGQSDFVGSDATAARTLLTRAASTAKTPVHLTVVASSGPRVSVDVTVGPAPAGTNAGARLFLAVVEDPPRVTVSRGENAGKSLEHPAVVRSLRPLDGVAPGGGTVRAELDLAPSWQRDHLRLVAFLQEEATQRVRGIGLVPLRTP